MKGIFSHSLTKYIFNWFGLKKKQKKLQAQTSMTQIGISRGERRRALLQDTGQDVDPIISVQGQVRCSVLDLASRHHQISLWELGKEGSGSTQDGTGGARATTGQGWLGGERSVYQEPKASANSEHGRWV